MNDTELRSNDAAIKRVDIEAHQTTIETADGQARTVAKAHEFYRHEYFLSSG